MYAEQPWPGMLGPRQQKQREVEHPLRVVLSRLCQAAMVQSLHPSAPFVGRFVSVEPLEERHRDGLREAAAEAPETFRYTGLGYMPFDRWLDEALGAGDEVPFALIAGGREVGSTRFLAIVPEHRRAEIGWTWLRRSVWGRA